MEPIQPYIDPTPAAENLQQQEALLIRECIRLMGHSLESHRVMRWVTRRRPPKHWV